MPCVIINLGVSYVVISVNLSGTTLNNIGAFNTGDIVGAITVTTSPPGHATSPVTLSGPDAAKFSITNGGVVPCNLIAATNIPAGSYSISLTAT